MNNNKKGWLTLALIILTFALPAIGVRFFVNPAELPKNNRGELIEPHLSFNQLQLLDTNQQIFGADNLTGQWSLLYIVPSLCEQACLNSLYSIRQVKQSLDKDMDRVRLITVTHAELDTKIQATLNTDYTDIVQLSTSQAIIDQTLQSATELDSESGHIYMVSPDGWLFMHYPSYEDHEEAVLHARDIRKDLKRTLKGSRIG